MKPAGRLFAVICLAALAGCGQMGGTACLLPSQQTMLQIDMFFGRDIDGRPPVGDAEWDAFARQVITPRFPDGFTIFDARGQWLNPATRRIGGEASKMVRIDTVAGPDTAARVRGIADAYRARFHQDAVGVVSSAVCGVF
jgi:hypothetical protein